MRRRSRWRAIDAHRISLELVHQLLAEKQAQAAADLSRRNRQAMLRVARAA